jgi:hypothetical protein
MSYKNNIKIVKNFLSEDEMEFFRDYEDYVLENMYDRMAIFNNGNRPILQFGKDFCHEESHLSLDIISDIENKVRDLFNRVELKAKEIFNDKKQLYVCSFWLAKQLPGAFVMEHEDTDSGNTHFKYSAVIYLNNLKDSGELIFSDLDYSYMPGAGDIVIFKSIDSGKHFVEPINEERYTIPMWITEDPAFAL